MFLDFISSGIVLTCGVAVLTCGVAVHFVVSLDGLRVCGFRVLELMWLELDPKKEVDSVLGSAMSMFEIDAAMLG